MKLNLREEIARYFKPLTWFRRDPWRPRQMDLVVRSVRRLRLRPDDVIVISVDRFVDQASAERIRDLWGEKFPHTKCIVMSSDMHIDVVISKPEEKQS